MRKFKKVLVIFIAMVMLTSCGNDPNNSNNTNNPIEKGNEFDPSNLNTEEDIVEYLVGDWVYDYYYRGDVITKMSIDENLDVKISFDNSYSTLPQGDYTGKITLDRMYVEDDDAPDMICLEMDDEEEPGGDFFFLHRTLYGGKRVMSLFSAGNGNTIFDVEDDLGDFRQPADEIYFEKTTNEYSKEEIRLDDDFYAVYWGMGEDGKSLWLDDIWWDVVQDDYSRLYPWRMTIYENQISGSILYKVDPNEISEVLGDEMQVGEVYYVQTNEKGEIIHLIDAERKRWMEEEEYGINIDGPIYDVILYVDEIQEYLDMGMSIQYHEGTEMIDGEEFYKIALGTQHEEHFVKELFYAVNIFTGDVYRYNVQDDEWKAVPLG